MQIPVWISCHCSKRLMWVALVELRLVGLDLNRPRLDMLQTKEEIPFRFSVRATIKISLNLKLQINVTISPQWWSGYCAITKVNSYQRYRWNKYVNDSRTAIRVDCGKFFDRYVVEQREQLCALHQWCERYSTEITVICGMRTVDHPLCKANKLYSMSIVGEKWTKNDFNQSKSLLPTNRCWLSENYSKQ